MFVILHGASDLSDIKLAGETGFSAVGFFPTKDIGYKEISTLIKCLPPFFFSMVTTSTTKFEDLSTITSITRADSLGITDKIKKEEIIRLKKSSPNIKLIQIFSAGNIFSDDLYRALAALSEADAVILDFHQSPQGKNNSNNASIKQFISQATKPIIFAGLGSIHDAKFLISNYRPYGVLLPKQLLYSDSYSAKEVIKELKLSYYHSEVRTDYPSQKIIQKSTGMQVSSSTNNTTFGIDALTTDIANLADKPKVEDIQSPPEVSGEKIKEDRKDSKEDSKVDDKKEVKISKPSSQQSSSIPKEKIMTLDESVTSTDWESWAKAAKINN